MSATTAPPAQPATVASLLRDPRLPQILVLASLLAYGLASGAITVVPTVAAAILVRDAERTVVTMASDYRGAPEDFALVVPVPSVLTREQIHVAEPALVEHLDAYTAPRLVEYHDPDPCSPRLELRRDVLFESESAAAGAPGAGRGKAAGVRIEAVYTVGEYDVVLLSADEWKTFNGDSINFWPS